MGRTNPGAGSYKFLDIAKGDYWNTYQSTNSKQAAEALGIQVQYLSRLRRQGQITGTPVGNGHYEYARAEVERFANRPKWADRRGAR